ncbi:hypothetical protein IMCC1989_2072 [gamma proteobacterium IMCC1989]|nr:hypothetical protein IMCC1989_2072 [gamma proteobacterium IMCC1989]
MPAEYGIDPTRIGEAIGLKRMGEIRISLETEAADTAKAEQPSVAIVASEKPTIVENVAITKTDSVTSQNHEITFTLAPDEGTEVKVTMIKGAKVNYIWETNGGKSNFDVHGDSKELKIKYHPYYKGTDSKREGTLEAAFDGGHGWFWRNRTKQSLTITIKTDGEYTDIIRY